MSLIDKIREARKSRVTIGDKGFTIMRPTDMDVVRFKRDNIQDGDILRRYVVDWHDFKEIDLIPGGVAVGVPFETDLFMEWVADDPETWLKLVDEIIGAYRAHDAKRLEAEKKTDNG